MLETPVAFVGDPGTSFSRHVEAPDNVGEVAGLSEPSEARDRRLPARPPIQKTETLRSPLGGGASSVSNSERREPVEYP